MVSSKTHFEVLGLALERQVFGLGLEASSSRKLPCPRIEDSTNIWIVENLQIAWKIIFVDIFLGKHLKKNLKTFFGDRSFFGEHLRLCPWSLASSIPVLGVERVCPRKGCPWPRVFLRPWPRAFLFLASRQSVLGRAVLGLGLGYFLCLGLGLDPCVLDCTSAIQP